MKPKGSDAIAHLPRRGVAAEWLPGGDGRCQLNGDSNAGGFPADSSKIF